MTAHAAPFDAVAAGYDASFTERSFGRRLRARTWSVLDAAFPPGSRVLDLGCGTGVDAVHLAARGVTVVGLDPAGAMVARARRAAAAAGMAGAATFVQARAEDVGDEAVVTGRFAGAFSNFGALNCVADLAAVGRGLARRVVPGGRVVLVLMGPGCLWEWAWYGWRAPRTALRRVHGPATAVVGGAPVVVCYPSPSAVSALFGPAFRVRSCRALGVALPPTYAAPAVESRPRLAGALAFAEDLLWDAPAAWAVADHYILELARAERPELF